MKRFISNLTKRDVIVNNILNLIKNNCIYFKKYDFSLYDIVSELKSKSDIELYFIYNSLLNKE